VSAIDTDTASPSARTVTCGAPAPSIASSALSIRLGPDLVQLARVGVDRRHVGPVVADDRDATQLVAEHRQRAVDSARDIDTLHRRAIHL
jgi:hypothetical protein